MKNNVSFKLAASTVVLGLTMVGCKPASSTYRPAAISSNVVKAEAEAAKAYAGAQAAFAKGDISGALALAERAVEASPRDVAYRMMLGDLYLKSGRFVSAADAFTDVISLNPGNARATLSLALAQIAQGKSAEAVANLDGIVASAAAADTGLAYALAGQPQRAIDLLEPAARAPEANGRVRQNLALAYAIAGDWAKARIVAAQDLSPAELGARLEQWANFANPSATHLRVASLLNTTAVQDSGQPVRLALAPPAPEQPVYADAVTAQVEEVVVAQAAAQGPVEEVIQAPAPPAVEVASHAVAEFAPPAAVETATVEVPASQPWQPAKEVSGEQFAAAVTSLVEAPAPAEEASAKIAPAPIQAFVPQKAVKKPAAAGRYVVQIGAYRHASQVEKAWAQAVRRYRFGGGEPLSTTVRIPGKGTFHRLAVSGFNSPVAAARLCQTIRSQHGSCFVRVSAGDSPVQWASRYSRRA
jgi:Flp pilus assembly protein TadD